MTFLTTVTLHVKSINKPFSLFLTVIFLYFLYCYVLNIYFRSNMSDSYLYVYNIEQPACDIEFSELSSLKFLVEGGFGKVYTAQWKGQHVAAKTVSRRSPQQLKDFNRELNALRKSKNCKEYIIQFFRLSKGYEVGEYILVLQYADGVTLKNYLNNNILELDHKISLCKDIVKELEFLHKENIIHSDLHSKNVLIHQRRELLVDFGLSKSLLESKGKSDVREIQAYVDPKLLDKTFDYTNGKFSDIYSFGVLMWEIYTCRLLFEGRHGLGFTISLCNGLRENRQVGMPWDYVNIYENCWNPDPSFRPDATDILNELENLKKKNRF
ncbi:kinase-like domain-containing protein [Gigaspora rosea]|uniref:Kinase-like domain-containing protein n=1 Tax=Gigaspora rosea TaxID=44941 RepID=A0A397VHW1_9GLOM|nr:kinase-like domain-containing protein [Gigaspora rosea]